MKQGILLVSILFCFSFHDLKAQFVTIPDSAFVVYLNNNFPSCMNGNQMDTTCIDIVNHENVMCQNRGIGDLTGIQYFDNLKLLRCYSNHLSVIPSLSQTITSIECEDNMLTALPALPNHMEVILCHGNQITALPQPLPDSLIMLYFHSNLITTVPPLPAALKFLSMGSNPITVFPALPQLELLFCTGQGWTQLPPLPATLKEFNCGGNQLTTLPALPYGIEKVRCPMNQLTSLPSIPSTVTELLLYGNQLTSLPPLPDSLSHLNIMDNPQLACLPEIRTIGNFQWSNTAITCLPNVLHPSPSISYPPVNTLPVCELFNSNGCETFWNISGYVFSDSSGNCIYDNNDSPLSNIKINLYQNGQLVQQTFTDHFGNYTFKTDTGTYQYGPDTTGIPLTITCVAGGSHTSVITLTDSLDTDRDFAAECIPGSDLSVNSIVHAGGEFRPAHQALLSIYAGDLSAHYGVDCAVGLSGDVTVLINGPASFSAPYAGSLTPVVNGNTVTYTIADFSSVSFTDFMFYVLIDTAAQLSEQVCFDVTVNPVAGDINPLNNNYAHCLSIVNSYDPNDKQGSPTGIIDTTQEWLTYTIRFQNTGNAPAQHIYILDTLDSDIDESSIQLLSYSHEPLVQLTGNLLRFNFPGINLPDSVNDEPNSHGYVQYKVKLNNGLPIGTQIENTAYIYFDFNPPVQTNTVSNTIDVITSVSWAGSPSFFIYPNPVNSGSVLSIDYEKGKTNLLIHDMTGRLVFKEVVQGSRQIQLPLLNAGVYLCVIHTAEGTVHQKLIVR